MSEYSKRVIAKLDAKRQKDENETARVLYERELLDHGMNCTWSELKACVGRKCSELSDDGIEVAF